MEYDWESWNVELEHIVWQIDRSSVWSVDFVELKSWWARDQISRFWVDFFVGFFIKPSYNDFKLLWSFKQSNKRSSVSQSSSDITNDLRIKRENKKNRKISKFRSSQRMPIINSSQWRLLNYTVATLVRGPQKRQSDYHILSGGPRTRWNIANLTFKNFEMTDDVIYIKKVFYCIKFS